MIGEDVILHTDPGCDAVEHREFIAHMLAFGYEAMALPIDMPCGCELTVERWA